MKKHSSLIASHRGGSLLWPENSMLAFGNTTRLDVEQVEFDVHPTKDGQLVVHHDPTLDRMTTGNGSVVDQTYEELKRWTINGTDKEHIPLFVDVLELFKPTTLTLRIEIKGDVDMHPYPGLEQKVATMLGTVNLLERTVITSFLIPVLKNFHEAEPSVPRIWLVHGTVYRHLGGIESVLLQARENGLNDVAIHINNLTTHEMDTAAEAGITLGAYSVHDEVSLRHAIGLKVPVFTSDRPDLAIKIRSDLNG